MQTITTLVISLFIAGCENTGDKNFPIAPTPHSAVENRRQDFACICSGYSSSAKIPDDAKTIEINANSTGFVNVRSSNANFSKEYTDNILCQIPCGSTLHAVGPIKNKESGAGLCYHVYLKDSTGMICNGFIAYSCVK